MVSERELFYLHIEDDVRQNVKKLSVLYGKCFALKLHGLSGLCI